MEKLIKKKYIGAVIKNSNRGLIFELKKDGKYHCMDFQPFIYEDLENYFKEHKLITIKEAKK